MHDRRGEGNANASLHREEQQHGDARRRFYRLGMPGADLEVRRACRRGEDGWRCG